MAKDFSLLGFLYSKGVSMSDLVLIYNESPFLIKSEVSKQRCELRNTSLTLETVLSNLEPQERLQVQNLITSCHTEVPTGLNVVFNLVTLKDAFESCSKEQKLASLLNLTTYAKENFKVEFDQWSGISLESSDFEKLKSIVKLGIKGVTWKLTYTVKLERTLLDSDFSRIKKTLHDVKATNVNDLGKLVWEWSNKTTN